MNSAFRDACQRRLPLATAHWRRRLAALALACISTATTAQGQPLPGQMQTDGTATSQPSAGGPIRLRQAGPAATPLVPAPAPREAAGLAVLPPSDFEIYVNSLGNLGAGKTEPLRRFGSNLWQGTAHDSQDGSPLVPSDYVLQPGDEITVAVWGSVDADLRLQIDRTGRVTVPRVGPITLVGVRYGDLVPVLMRRFDRVFKNYQLTAGLAQLRGMRVYVTGFVPKPGPYTVSSLSSVVNALSQAGGPSAAGSLRNVQLRRGKTTVATIDLYDILLRGDRSSDRLVQPEDVIHIEPVGAQVAMVGSVNRPAIFELKSGETLNELVLMSGGFTAVADRSRVSIERLTDRNAGRVAELKMPEQAGTRLESGDVVRAFSAVDAALPLQQKNKLVRVEGEVLRPGEYLLPANSSVSDALRTAGGLTPTAYVFATEFTRRSVQATQQANYDRVVRELELQLTRTTSTQRANTPEDISALANSKAAAERLISSLRLAQPTGRVVLELGPTANELPDLALEDGDRIYVPPKSSTIGVFGSVFNAGSYLYRDGRLIGDYLGLAGGPTKGSDPGSIMVLRANGTVVAATQQRGSVWSSGSTIDKVGALAGDTIFVPEEFNKEGFRTVLKDWTSIFYNFGLGAAAIKAVFN